MQENKTSIFIYKYPNNIISSIYLILSPKDMFKDIDFSNERFIYLSQQYFEYNLYFSSNSKNFYIRLDSQTPDAEIEILDKNNTILNKDSNYYFINKKTKKISLRIKNNNSALIEFLYEFNNFTSLDIKQKEFHLDDGYHLLRYKKSDKIKLIKVNLESNYNLSLFIFANIGKGNFLGALPEEKDYDFNNVSSEFIFPKEKINEDETFNILFKVKTNVTLKVETTKEDKDDDKGNDSTDDGLPLWALILIISFGSLIAILILFIIIKRIRRNRKNKKNIIEEISGETGALLNSFSNE